MGRRKREIATSYIADAILITKKERFNEEFTTIEEVNIIKQVIEKRIEERNLNIKFVDAFFDRYFEITDGIITKSDKDTLSLKYYLSAPTIYETDQIQETIYDEELIHLCLCEITIDKLNNSIERTCATCNFLCCGGRSEEQAKDCSRWTHDFNAKQYKILKKALKI